MRAFAALLVLWIVAGSPPARAEVAPLARVVAVQPPAWIESRGARKALDAGRVLKAGDRIVTGAHARVHVELADASIVKLGEDADFRIPQVARLKNDGDTLFKSALNVVKGAFRFTTRALGKPMKRDVDVTIGVATAGVRGTDLWGKSDGEQDLIALLEGRIEVGAEGGERQIMDQPGTAFVVPRGKAPLPVKPLSSETIAQFAAQTEMSPDAIALFADGPNSVRIASFDNRDAAASEARAWSDKGYAAQVAQRKPGFDLVLRGFGSKGEASRFARHLRESFGASQATAM